MIRFLPDTWRDALLRPVAMSAPDGSVYVETMAPELKFLFCLIVLLILILAPKRGKKKAIPVGLTQVIAYVWLSFVVWLLTTGNGRYFIPGLLLAGPMCIGLIWLLPISRSARCTAAFGVLGLQVWVNVQAYPFQQWTFIGWQQGHYIDLSIPGNLKNEPATFVTISSISYSLIAPLFHSDSRWMNISSQPGSPGNEEMGLEVQKVLSTSKDVYLVVPTIKNQTTKEGYPTQSMFSALNVMLGNQRLSLRRAEDCKIATSMAMSLTRMEDRTSIDPGRLKNTGFWICQLVWNVGDFSQKGEVISAESLQAFSIIERICPRFFKPGQTKAERIESGALRRYTESDMKLYVLDNGDVYYLYWRAINPEFIGNIKDINEPNFILDCTGLRGRSGLPWERRI